jgi:hypothetical protein
VLARSVWRCRSRDLACIRDGKEFFIDDERDSERCFVVGFVPTRESSASIGRFKLRRRNDLFDASGIGEGRAVKASEFVVQLPGESDSQVGFTGSWMLGKVVVDRMGREAKEHVSEDKVRREAVDFRNQTEALAFQAEKTLTDLGDKVDAEKKAQAETLIGEVREALKGESLDPVKEKAEALAKVMSEIGTAAYAQNQQAGTPEGAEGASEKAAGEETIEGEAQEV